MQQSTLYEHVCSERGRYWKVHHEYHQHVQQTLHAPDFAIISNARIGASVPEHMVATVRGRPANRDATWVCRTTLKESVSIDRSGNGRPPTSKK